jgi:DNA-binding LacI/PurR family transcriptional regulator
LLLPSLTTVRAPTQEVGQEAVKKLIQIFDKKEVEYLTLLPTEIVIRDSCGCHNLTADKFITNRGGDAIRSKK